MTSSCDLNRLVFEFEQQLIKYNATPGRGRCYAAPAVFETFARIAAADPRHAFDMIAGDERVASLCRGRIPALLAGMNPPVALSLLEHVGAMSGTDAATFIEIGKAARKRSKLRRAALDKVVAIADETGDWLRRARFCANHLAKLQEVSLEHAVRLAETVARDVDECPINCESDYKVAQEFGAQLSRGNLLPEVRDEVSRRLRTYEQLRELKQQVDATTSAIATARKHLTEAPATEEDFRRELDGLMTHSVTMQNEDDGEFYDRPAFDGKRLCVGDGDDMAELWGGFGRFVNALRDLMWSVDLDEVRIDWSKCPMRFPEKFGEIVEQCEGGGDFLESYLDETNLADVDHEGWDGGAPGCSGVWVRVWVPRDRVIPLLRELWAGYRYAASIVIPALEERLRNLVN